MFLWCLLIDAVKALLGPTVMNWMVLILCIALSITFTISRVFKGRSHPQIP